MKRSPLKRKTALKRKPGELDRILMAYHGFKPRKKPLGPGKKTKARKSAMKQALDAYFAANGYQNEEGEWVSVDQVTGLLLYKRDAVLHHKTPRSELRKAGVKDLDAPHRLIVTHWAIHVGWVHSGWLGRPYRTHEHDGEADKERRFRIIEHSPAHAGNNELVDWSPQDRADMLRFIGIRGGI